MENSTQTQLFRDTPRDVALVAVALLQALTLLAALQVAQRLGGGWLGLAAAIVAVGLWWNANTVAHIHLHRPIFVQRLLNRTMSVWLSVLLGFPQVVWRHRHLWHHAGEPAAFPRLRWGVQGALELTALVGFLACLALTLSHAFFFAYLPGYALGMLLCQVQGHFEHHQSGQHNAVGISYYSRWYNQLWFNDGFHVEHHRQPSLHWTRLPTIHDGSEPTSAQPPLTRWLASWQRGGLRAAQALVLLEKLAIALPPLQRAMVATHRRAFARLLPELAPAGAILIVGGGLFPRSYLALHALYPQAIFALLDVDAAHLAQASLQLQKRNVPVPQLITAGYSPKIAQDFAWVVLPLAYVGDLEADVANTGATLIEHAWAWQKRGNDGCLIAWWLGKRMNLHQPKKP